jgi:MFS family permease
MRRVLQLPVYRRLLGAYTLNELAWSFAALALSFLVYSRTGSALSATAFFLCSQFVPALVSPMIVARLDQRTPRRVLPVLYALEAVAFLALAWIASNFALAGILILATLDGIVALVARSLARALTARVTGDAGLLRAGNAVANTAFSLCFMAGPGIGGAIVATASASVALLVNCGLFAVMALMLATTRGLPEAVPDRPSGRGRVRAALAYVKDRPSIRALLGLTAAGVLFFTISIPVEVVFAQHTLHAGAGGYGALLSAWGVGAVLGSGAYARWRARPARQLIAAGAGALGVGFVVMAAAPALWIAVVGSAVAGVGNGVEAVAARTALQEEVEPQWMALMMSFSESTLELVPGIGILLGGAVAGLAGPRVALAIGGIGSLVVTAAVWVVLRPGVLEAEASPAAPEPDHGEAAGPTVPRVNYPSDTARQARPERHASPARSQQHQ